MKLQTMCCWWLLVVLNLLVLFGFKNSVRISRTKRKQFELNSLLARWKLIRWDAWKVAAEISFHSGSSLWLSSLLPSLMPSSSVRIAYIACAPSHCAYVCVCVSVYAWCFLILLAAISSYRSHCATCICVLYREVALGLICVHNVAFTILSIAYNLWFWLS